MAPPEDPVRRRFHFREQKTRAALLYVGGDATHAVRIGNVHRNRSADAYGLDLGINGQHGVRRHYEERDHTDDREGNDGYDCFHCWLVVSFYFLASTFLTQESIHSMNVLYQSMLFCGFRTQWPSSGKSKSFEGTFCSWRAVNNSNA